MKRLSFLFTLAICCLWFSPNLLAQDDDAGYVVVEYMKVKPGMMDEYLECENIWKMIHQERKNAGLITGWELEQVLYPSGTGTEYDFVTITHFSSWKAIDDLNDSWNEATWNKLTQKLSSAQKEMVDKVEMYRELVKREIWTAQDVLEGEGVATAKYRVENFMKIPAGGWEDWIEMETRFAKPVHQKSIDMGIRSGWYLTTMIMPGGEEMAYNASTLDMYNSWEDMNKDEGAAWQAVYPDMSFAHANKRFESTRTLVRSEVRMLFDYIQ
ncbi:MAG: hypothetical protein AB8H47_11450 [Bacteroidia bacterium]